MGARAARLSVGGAAFGGPALSGTPMTLDRTPTQAAGHVARKRFGQNFLVDVAVIDQILMAVGAKRGDRVVEIGPGLSAITEPLLAMAGELAAIEIDRDLAARLRQRFADRAFSLIEADALTVDFTALAQERGGKLRVVGNLPYNISSPILFHLLTHADWIIDQHVMLQKEVVDRMVAPAGDSERSRLSVMLQARYRMTKLFDVAPEAFDPPPKVVSAVVRMLPLGPDRRRPKDAHLFEQIVQASFAQRRKMLRGNLAAWKDLIDWDEVGIAPTHRAEALTVAQFMDLADFIAARTREGHSI